MKILICSKFRDQDGEHAAKLGLCHAEVPGRWGGFQCTYHNGHGPEGKLCKRHARIAERDGFEVVS